MHQQDLLRLLNETSTPAYTPKTDYTCYDVAIVFESDSSAVFNSPHSGGADNQRADNRKRKRAQRAWRVSVSIQTLLKFMKLAGYRCDYLITVAYLR